MKELSCDFRIGVDVSEPTLRYALENGVVDRADVFCGPVASYFLNAWTPEHPTNTPGIGQWSSTSGIGSEALYTDAYVRPADFLKIRNIVLSYELPEMWLEKIRLQRASVSFQLNNPKWLWVKNKVGIDPETLSLRDPSSFVFGLNINI